MISTYELLVGAIKVNKYCRRSMWQWICRVGLMK
mgnify:CR=1 FL=1|jgi:hypothetical protein